MSNLVRKVVGGLRRSLTCYPSSNTIGDDRRSSSSERRLLSWRSRVSSDDVDDADICSPSTTSSSSIQVTWTSQDLPIWLDVLEKVINQMTEPETQIPPLANKQAFSKQQILRENFNQNLQQFGTVFEKAGGAANGQVSAVTSPSQVAGEEYYAHIARVCRGVGNMHWVGVFLLILGVILDRYLKMKKNHEDLLHVLKRLLSVGKKLFHLHSRVGGNGSELDETLQNAVKVICGYAARCTQAATARKNFLQIFLSVDSTHAKLVDIEKQIDNLHNELTLSLAISSSPTPTVQKFASENTVLVGVPGRVEEAQQKLTSVPQQAQKVIALVMTGIHGNGKSTVGLALAAKLREHAIFDNDQSSAYVDLSRRKWKEENWKVEEKQHKLYDELTQTKASWTAAKFPDPCQGREELRNCFSSRDKPVLLFIDNVNEEDLADLLPVKLDILLKPGSILLVTTSDQAVFNCLWEKGVVCVSYKVKELNEGEARHLLSMKIFGSKDLSSNSDLRAVIEDEKAKELLKVCGGIPLAINVVGGYILKRGRDFICSESRLGEAVDTTLSLEAAYKELKSTDQEKCKKRIRQDVKHAVKHLSDGDPITHGKEPLHSCLTFAYGQLTPELQSIFLDIIASHVGRAWKDVKRLYGRNLKELEDLSMLKKSLFSYGDGTITSRKIVDVHYLFIGIGRRMANLHFPGKRLVVGIGMEVESANQIADYIKEKHPEILKLCHCKEEHFSPELLNCAKVDQLRQLHLIDAKVPWKCEEIPTKLRHLECTQGSSLPFSLSQQRRWDHLVLLDVDLKTDTTSDFTSIHSMPSLKMVKISNSRTLQELGPNLNKLEEVEVHNSPKFERIGDSIPDCFRKLKVVSCPKFEDFSGVGKLGKCEELSLLDCDLTDFPTGFKVPSEVKMLDLSYNRNMKVLPAFGATCSIKKLYLTFCSSLRRIDEKSSCPATLICLHLIGCEMLEEIVVDSNLLTLTQLDVRGCWALRSSEFLKRFPASVDIVGLGDPAQGHNGLRQRFRHSYKIFRQVPQEFKNLKNIKILKTCCTFPPTGRGRSDE